MINGMITIPYIYIYIPAGNDMAINHNYINISWNIVVINGMIQKGTYMGLLNIQSFSIKPSY